MKKKWYLVIKKKLYEYYYLEVDKFITQEPNKFVSAGNYIYTSEEIKVK